MVDAQAATVVSVIMRDYQGIYIRNIAAVRGEPALRLPAADPGVKGGLTTVDNAGRLAE